MRFNPHRLRRRGGEEEGLSVLRDYRKIEQMR